MVTIADAHLIAFRALDKAFRKPDVTPQPALPTPPIDRDYQKYPQEYFVDEGLSEKVGSTNVSPLKFLVPENQDRGPQVDPTAGAAHTWVEFRLRHSPRFQVTNWTEGVAFWPYFVDDLR